MKKLIWTWSAIAGIALLAAPSAAEAQQAKDWLVCGGNSTTFSTCASVFLTVGEPDVDGRQQVMMKVWNLSGMDDTYAGSVFTKIGFFHEAYKLSPGGIDAYAEGPVTMDGTKVGNAQAWVIDEPGSGNGPGGVYLDLATENGNGVNNGIASACDPSSYPADAEKVWTNPCFDTTENYRDGSLSAADGWVTLEFDVVGTWDLASTEMLIFAQNGDGAEDSLQCITGGDSMSCEPVRVPEPTTWLLLATGLLGLGFVSIRRRRESEFDLAA